MKTKIEKIDLTCQQIHKEFVENFNKYKEATIEQIREESIRKSSFIFIDNFHKTAYALSDIIDQLTGAPVYRVIEFINDVFSMKIIDAIVKAKNSNKVIDDISDNINDGIYYSAIMIMINKCLIYRDARRIYETAVQRSRNNNEKEFSEELLKKLDKYEYDSLEFIKSLYSEFYKLFTKAQEDEDVKRNKQELDILLEDNGFGYILAL